MLDQSQMIKFVFQIPLVNHDGRQLRWSGLDQPTDPKVVCTKPSEGVFLIFWPWHSNTTRESCMTVVSWGEVGLTTPLILRLCVRNPVLWVSHIILSWPWQAASATLISARELLNDPYFTTGSVPDRVGCLWCPWVPWGYIRVPLGVGYWQHLTRSGGFYHTRLNWVFDQLIFT